MNFIAPTIPTPYMIAARVVGVLLVLLLAAGAGAVVNGWRLSEAHAKAIAGKVQEVADLTLAIEKQNSAIAQMRSATDAANTARQRAEQEAIAQRKAAKTRDEWISKLQGTCSDNIQEAWGRM